jgi:hypothetical protein
VMDRLQDMARSDPKPPGTEILIRVSPHGVMWQTPKGVKPSEYDLAACEQTLRRWKRKLDKDIKSS